MLRLGKFTDSLRDMRFQKVEYHYRYFKVRKRIYENLMKVPLE